MPSKQTTNYHLSQWVKSDKVLMDDFNADNLAIDAALAGKAESSALNALSQRVDGKADAAELSEVKQTVSGHTTAMSKKGNCIVHYQTYTGNGKNGSSDPTVIKFPNAPQFVVVHNGRLSIMAARGMTTVFARDGSSAQALHASWPGTSLSLYDVSSAATQMNNANTTYTVVALLSADS